MPDPRLDPIRKDTWMALATGQIVRADPLTYPSEASQGMTGRMPESFTRALFGGTLLDSSAKRLIWAQPREDSGPLGKPVVAQDAGPGAAPQECDSTQCPSWLPPQVFWDKNFDKDLHRIVVGEVEGCGRPLKDMKKYLEGVFDRNYEHGTVKDRKVVPGKVKRGGITPGELSELRSLVDETKEMPGVTDDTQVCMNVVIEHISVVMFFPDESCPRPQCCRQWKYTYQYLHVRQYGPFSVDPDGKSRPFLFDGSPVPLQSKWIFRSDDSNNPRITSECVV